MQDWQHAAMYGAFLASGVVDLLGHWCPKGTLPPGLEHVRPKHRAPPARWRLSIRMPAQAVTFRFLHRCQGMGLVQVPLRQLQLA